jgi:hypothetical protein
MNGHAAAHQPTGVEADQRMLPAAVEASLALGDRSRSAGRGDVTGLQGRLDAAVIAVGDRPGGSRLLGGRRVLCAARREGVVNDAGQGAYGRAAVACIAGNQRNVRVDRECLADIL